MLKFLYFVNNRQFSAYTLDHIVMVLFVLTVIVWTKKFFKSGFKDRHNILRFTFIVIILIQQFSLYSWYYMNKSFNLIDAMPLYPCRIWQICMLLMLITDNPVFFPVTCLLGFPSAVIAFLIPDTGGNGFPNIMFDQYLIGHIMLMIVPMYEYYCKDMRLNSKSNIIAYKFIFAYSAIALFVNNLIGSNYGYLSKFPYETNFIKSLGIMYTVLYIVFAVSLTTLWYKILLRKQNSTDYEFVK